MSVDKHDYWYYMQVTVHRTTRSYLRRPIQSEIFNAEFFPHRRGLLKDNAHGWNVGDLEGKLWKENKFIDLWFSERLYNTIS